MGLKTRNQQQAADVLDTKASQTAGKSLQSFLASISVGAIVFGMEILLFILLRAS